MHSKLTASADVGSMTWNQVTVSAAQPSKSGVFVMASGAMFLGGQYLSHAPQFRFTPTGSFRMYFPGASVDSGKFRVTCHGDFPTELRVTTTELSPTGGETRALMTLYSPGASVDFIVDMGPSKAGSVRSLKLRGKGDKRWSLYSCTAKRL